ncbi:MAG: hypothetical protein ACR2QS_05145 [Woeseiaceae bacterium]
MSQKNILLSYYGGTLVFLLLDVALGLSIRIAFLDANTSFRMMYYGFCMACFLLMIWKPALTVLIGAIESLITLAALIVVMGLRVMLPTEQMIEAGTGFVTMPELLNFAIAGGIAYIAWTGGMKELLGHRRF